MLPILVSIIFTIVACILSILAPTKLSDISTATSRIYYNKNNLIINGFYIVDGTAYQTTEALLKTIRNTGILLLCFYGASFILNYLQAFILAGVNQSVTKKFRKEISAKINHIPLAYFDHTSYGDILSRVTNDVDTIGQSLNQSITSLISSITMLVGVIIAMMVSCWQLGLTTIATVPVSMILIIFIAKFSQKFYKNQQIYLGKLNGTIEETYSGAIVVKAFNGEKKALEEFKKSNEEIYNSAWKSNILGSLMMPITSFISNIGYVFICVIGGALFKNHTIEIGTITSFIVYLNLFRSPIQQISQAMTYLQQMAASSERVFEFLEIEEQPDENEKQHKLRM